ncbi:hypothetical protein PR048_019272 [Dryococelus australis]|uniref:Uncharacterized protein n=1 Tax=Dryococelus australis TaxID=614101 RepID=A0ABQ9H318_9NEOP|nr:hypothetical protein PR048_019272 [Dryococelus australis]
MEQRRNARAGKTGGPRENSPTRVIVRHDSHMRKSQGVTPTWNRTRFALAGDRCVRLGRMIARPEISGSVPSRPRKHRRRIRRRNRRGVPETPNPHLPVRQTSLALPNRHSPLRSDPTRVLPPESRKAGDGAREDGNLQAGWTRHLGQDQRHLPPPPTRQPLTHTFVVLSREPGQPANPPASPWSCQSWWKPLSEVGSKYTRQGDSRGTCLHPHPPAQHQNPIIQPPSVSRPRVYFTARLGWLANYGASGRGAGARQGLVPGARGFTAQDKSPKLVMPRRSRELFRGFKQLHQIKGCRRPAEIGEDVAHAASAGPDNLVRHAEPWEASSTSTLVFALPPLRLRISD